MRLGITLSGGGTRCVAHLAVIKSLQEKGIVAQEYSGTSGGALAAALLASGLSPEKIMEVVSKTSLFLAIRPAFTLSGLLDVEKALSFALQFLPQTFEELNLPVTVGTTNIRTGMSEFFSSGPLIPPILASCCVPVIFKPVMINGEYYMDGGPVNNLPVEPIREKCDKIIGIHTNPIDRNFKMNHMKGLLERTFLLTVNANVDQRKKLCDVYLEPECLKGFKVFDFKRVPEVFELTDQWIRLQLPGILEKLT